MRSLLMILAVGVGRDCLRLLVLDAHADEVAADGVLEALLVALGLNDGGLVALDELLDARLQHLLEVVLLHVVDDAEAELLGARVDDHEERVVDDLRLRETQRVVVHADVEDLVHVVPHRHRPRPHLEDEVVVVVDPRVSTEQLAHQVVPVSSVQEELLVEERLMLGYRARHWVGCQGALNLKVEDTVVGTLLPLLVGHGVRGRGLCLFGLKLFLLDEAVEGRALEVIANQVLLVLLGDAEVEVLAHEHVLLYGLDNDLLGLLGVGGHRGLHVLGLVIGVDDSVVQVVEEQGRGGHLILDHGGACLPLGE
uniref:Uncharacterized protein n=1 Tax=Strombidium rassoulzadegani TaxID=1082188 RepID=A0A7S3CTN6_9SPIT|mmetsp:Transcript_8646/g.14640  ORF Transcript_8646/g.14640 Transcript_8646/m.14640 type:complete len:310 (+) Transcript_8646:3-932(+)